ncbi:MAG: hypothetical protein SGJ21_15485 [Alphaproteobacteria bacterium]|nr:hypothetical protein [Alphaproteobacteria bacterium]
MAALIRREEWEVNARLRELRMPKEALLETVRAAVAAYGGCTDNDPPGAKGYETYRIGTRHLRVEMLPLKNGWNRDDAGNLCSIRNDEIAVKVVILNTDDATGDALRTPKNRREKGVEHERAIEGVSRFFLGMEPNEDIRHAIWYLCLHINEDKVLAELSRPSAIDGGFIVAWEERIILVAPGGWGALDIGADDNDSGPELEIDVRRK